MMDVIAMFKETDARDVRGLGAIRDRLADQFFAGMSAVRTRVRYFFVVPWIHRSLDLQGVSGKELTDWES